MTKVQRWWIVAAALAAALFACAVGAIITAFAAPADEPTLVYDGASKSFSYRNIEGSDLFSSFKDLVPGDELTQQFTVQLQHLERPTTIYLRSAYEAEEIAGLEAVKLSVTANGAKVADGAPGSGNQLDRDAKLASLDHDGSFAAEVDLSVPTSVGNELADSAHKLHWVFTAQEDDGDGSAGGGSSGYAGAGSGDGNASTGAPTITAQATSSAIAQTGDATPPLALMAVLAAAAFALFVLAIRNTRRP